MNPQSAEQKLRNRIQQTGTAIEKLQPADGIQQMLLFYEQDRSEGCALESDGDMLLYQWGTYDWGEGRFFEFDITRQFIADTDEDDDVISQLRLTFYYLPSPEFDALKPGNMWCHTPDKISDFRSFVTSTAAYNIVLSRKPHKVELTYGAM